MDDFADDIQEFLDKKNEQLEILESWHPPLLPPKELLKRSRFGTASYFRQNKRPRGKNRKATKAYNTTLPSHHVLPYEGERESPKLTATIPGHSFIDPKADIRPIRFKESDSIPFEDYPVNAKLSYKLNRKVDF